MTAIIICSDVSIALRAYLLQPTQTQKQMLRKLITADEDSTPEGQVGGWGWGGLLTGNVEEPFVKTSLKFIKKWATRSNFRAKIVMLIYFDCHVGIVKQNEWRGPDGGHSSETRIFSWRITPDRLAPRILVQILIKFTQVWNSNRHFAHLLICKAKKSE